MRRALLMALALMACTDAQTIVDPNATAIEVVTQLDASDGVTQLQLSATIGAVVGGTAAFAPGRVPEVPRALAGELTATVLLSESLDGTELFVRVDALMGGTVVRTGSGPATVRLHEIRQVEVTMGAPAVCGDGNIRSPFEECDDTNTTAGDGCSASCLVEPNWNCAGSPSICQPFATTKEITSFAFGSVNNPGLLADVQATITGTTIAATVPSGTNVGALVATFSTTGAHVTVTGTTQVSGTTANDFANIVIYQVTAEDGSTKSYAVIVTVASGGAKDLTAFAFLSSDNLGLAADVTGTITGTTVSLTVPSGTPVTGLVAAFSTTGANVKVTGVVQVSGSTANNFTSPVLYRVTAADGSTRDYMVTVMVASGGAKDLTAFAFLSVNNAGLAADVTGTIAGTAISLTVPSGTSVNALVATFSTSGVAVKVAGAIQISGTTVNNFTGPVTYRVFAADGSTKDYVVTVAVAPNNAKDITSFAFLSVDNPSLPSDVIGTIAGTTISFTVPNSTSVQALVATFSTTGASVKVAGVTQVSGTTANDFRIPVSYRVTAADSSTKDYTVASAGKSLTTFAFLASRNAGLSADVTATINGAISLTVPFGTTVTALAATFATTGASVTVGGTIQVSGITANNFTGPVTYRVTAADGSTKDYAVNVTVAASTASDLTAFVFQVAHNQNLNNDATGTINGTNISLTVPNGTNVTALVATFGTTGTSVRAAGTLQVSGTTANNYTTPVIYRVTAADGSTKDYTVTVTEASGSAKDLTTFAFLSMNNPGLAVDVTGSINGTSISLMLPTGTNIGALVASFNTTGQNVTVAGVTQVSGTTANDFTTTVLYRVTAEDGSTKDYAVTITFV